MIKALISKLDSDIKCKLSIEELKILYEIDSDIDMLEYREKRANIYEDLVTIFGKEHVAQNEEEVTPNTICYVGYIGTSCTNLYNLRYLYGGIDYYPNHYHIDNLEKVFERLYLHGDCSKSDELYNLEKVQFMMVNENTKINNYPECVSNITYMDTKIDNVSLPKKIDKLELIAIKDEKDINVVFPDNLKGLQCASLTSITDDFISKLPSKLEILRFDSLNEVNNKNNISLPESLKLINFSKCSKFNHLKLPDNVDTMFIYSDKVDGLILPLNLKEFWGVNLRTSKNIKINDNLEELYLDNLESVSGLVLPSKLKKLVIRIFRNVETFRLPDSIEDLTLTTGEFTRINSLPSNLKKFTLVANRIYNVIFPESVEELNLPTLKTTNGLILPFYIKRLSLDCKLGISKLVFPEYMETIVLTSSYDRVILDKLDLEELVMNKREGMPKFFIDLYNGGLRYVDNLYISGGSAYSYFYNDELVVLDNDSLEKRYTVNVRKNKCLIKK